MSPHESALTAVNARLERLQGQVRQAKAADQQQFIVQSIVVTIGTAEALNDFVAAIGQLAEQGKGQLKERNAALEAEHAALLKTGQELLEKFKANPADASLRKELEQIQRKMAAVQKNLRREADARQRGLGPSLTMIDQVASQVRRLAEADQKEALKRLLKNLVAEVADYYLGARALPATDRLHPETWWTEAKTEIDEAAGFDDAYARAGYQITLSLELLKLAAEGEVPPSAAACFQRCREAAAARIRAVAARYQ